MDDDSEQEKGFHAPETWGNNFRHGQQTEATEAYEYRLYSDVWIRDIETIEIGPYALIPVGRPGHPINVSAWR